MDLGLASTKFSAVSSVQQARDVHRTPGWSYLETMSAQVAPDPDALGRRGIPGRRPSISALPGMPGALVSDISQAFGLSEPSVGDRSSLHWTSDEADEEIRSTDDEGSKSSFQSEYSTFFSGAGDGLPGSSQHSANHHRRSRGHRRDHRNNTPVGWVSRLYRKLRRLLRDLNVWVGLLQAVCYVYHIFVIPCQIAMVHSADVRLDTFYILGYTADGILVLCNFLQTYWAAQALGGWSRSLLFDGAFLAPLRRTLMALPLDALFWRLGSPGVVPLVRLVHLVPSVEHVYKLLALLQRSPSISYNKARLLHLLLLLSGVMHYVACIFVLVSRADTVLGDARQHYTSTPWLPDGSAETWRDQPETYEGGWVYLRAAYWAMMTLTTVGHVDQMDERDSQGGGSTFECVSRSRSGCLWGLPSLLAPSPPKLCLPASC